MASTSTPVEGPGAFKRRLSHPNPTISYDSPPSSYLPLPLGFPSVSSLRAALLGYLGEAENAVRERLGMEPVEEDYEVETDGARRLSVTSSPLPSSEDETEEGVNQTTTTALAPPTELRRRHGVSTPTGETRLRDHMSPPPTSDDHAMLDMLGKLREDILAYVPNVPSMPAGLSAYAPNREWLRSLPGRLQAVDLNLSGMADAAWADPVSASHRAVQGARRRVIDIVHSALPPDDWAGWETLGWEGNDRTPVQRHDYRANHVRGCSLDEKRRGDDDDDEPEPEYLFPNRTPGPASAIARRRLKRSKSLGDSDYPFSPSFLDQWMRPVSEVATIVDDEGEVDLAELEATLEEQALAEAEEDLLAHEVDVPCDKHGVHQVPDDVPTVAEALELSGYGTKLISFHALPVWWRNNQYILSGYRFIPLGKYGPIPLLKSAFSMHNETVNIHSHSIPTLFIFAIIPLIVWRTPLPDAHWVDTAMLISYLLAAASCLSSSAGWHILSGCANRRWFEWGACVDYIGISWLIAMSFNTLVYNAFYCRPKAVMSYTTVNVAFGALGSILPFQKWFNQRKNKHWRIVFFLALNAAMVAPIVHLFHVHGYTKAQAFVAPFGLSVLTYVVGLLFYAFHFPECCAPGKFDIWGASHNMWHLCIVGAIILHYRAVFHVFNTRWDYSCAAGDAQVPFPSAVDKLLFG